MTNNYTAPTPETEEEDMFTQAFTRNNDPATVASEAARREYSNILAQSQQQERTAQESYSDLYQRAQQASFRRQQATPSRGFTGGMEAQQQATLSAAEMQQLGNIGRSREQALREIRTGRQSAFSNALIAGQQQADYSKMLQEASIARQGQIESVIASEEYDDEAKRRLLKEFGLSDTEIDGIFDSRDVSPSPITIDNAQAQRDFISQAGGGIGNASVPNMANYLNFMTSLETEEEE